MHKKVCGRNKNKLDFNSSRGRIRWSAFKLYRHVNNDDHDDDHDDDDLDSNGDDDDDDHHDHDDDDDLDSNGDDDDDHHHDHDDVDDHHQQTMMTFDWKKWGNI